MATLEQLKVIKMLLDGIVESVKAAGSLGAPGGPLYAAMMAHGCTLQQFEQVMGILVSTGKLTKRADELPPF